MTLDALARPASLGEVGGFRPPDDPATSWAARVALAAPGEAWPTSDGAPMLALLQLAVRELPVVPDPLRDAALLTLFVGPFELPIDVPNGTGWCLRTYGTTEGLVPIEEPKPARADDPKAARGEPTTYRPFPVRWREVTDWPTFDCVPADLQDEWEADGAEDARPNIGGLKAGGWPTTVQGAPSWSENGEELADVEFVLQVDSDEKTGFSVGYGGVLYVGCRRDAGTWHCTWQSL